MSDATFDADWLALREPLDHRARADALLPELVAAWRRRSWSRVLDLGSGTGSNLRWLAPRLPPLQAWTLLDHDPALLARAEAVAPVQALERIRGDLAGEGLAAVADAHLVTGAALLDLVSERWLADLVHRCARTGCGALFVLSYDGRIGWSDADADDDPVRDAVNAHQRRDKGLGPALGPAAAATAERLFRDAGYVTRLLPSPWRIGPAERALARALVEGWERAAAEERPDRADAVRAWGERRRRTVEDGALGLEVGHLDLLALPAEATGPTRR